MNIKIGKWETEVSGLLVLAGLLIADGMYANHCRVKQYTKKIDALTKIHNNSQEETEEEES